jgi:hypothetical protein
MEYVITYMVVVFALFFFWCRHDQEPRQGFADGLEQAVTMFAILLWPISVVIFIISLPFMVLDWLSKKST